METHEQDANPMSSRSRHWDLVTDAGLFARRPLNDLEIESHDALSSHVGGGLLRPGVWSAPPTSTMSAGVDDIVAVRKGQSRGQGRFSIDTIDGRLRRQLQDDRLQRLDGWHGGAQSNLHATTRSSSFRAVPRRDADRHLHVDDATDDPVSATTPPDRSVYPRGNVDDQQSPRTGEMNSADFDDQRHVDPGPRDDVHGAGPADQQPTDPGRPAGRATVTHTCSYIYENIYLFGFALIAFLNRCICA